MANKPTKQATHKVGDYALVSGFVAPTTIPGYHAREDQTTLPAKTLVSPSQNVVFGTSGRLALVKGFVLDGTGSNTIDSGILSNDDFTNFKGDVRNMRAGFLTAAGNDGKLQYRYVAPGTTTVNWQTLKSALTTVRLAFTHFWDTTELKRLLLWVDGSDNVCEWNGAVTTFASCTANTITKQGTNTWDQEGFYQTRNKQVDINGVTYTYTGGDGTTTLTGVTPDPSGAGITAGTIVHQTPITTALSTMTSILSTFAPTVIGCGRLNQVYLGSSTSTNLYTSKVNSYTDYSFTTPVRVVGEGNLLPLQGAPTAFISQEVKSDDLAYDLWISQGTDTWSVIRSTLSSDLTKETIQNIVLKVSPLEGAKSQRLVGKMKNHIMFVDNKNVANFLGFVSEQFVPIITDFSFPIINDMESYDFTDASIFYTRNFALIAIPKAGVVRIYNMTDQSAQAESPYRVSEEVTNQPWFWEAPITYPISGFYVVNGNLYGHSYTTSESYLLFSSGSFNGQEITANATFAFDDKGDRTQSKSSDELWIEGYIKQNTVLSATVAGDLDAFQTTQTVTVNGNDNAIVAYGSGAHALGKNNLGSQPLGGALLTASSLPAWFHVAKSYQEVSCYLEQISFQTKGVDLQWELIDFGTNSQMTTEGNNSITQ